MGLAAALALAWVPGCSASSRTAANGQSAGAGSSAGVGNSAGGTTGGLDVTPPDYPPDCDDPGSLRCRKRACPSDTVLTVDGGWMAR